MNILTGGRGVGKTYGVQKIIIKDFLKNKNQFVWLRRYKSETKVAKNGWFNKIQAEFPNTKFEIKGNAIYIDEELAGCFVSLSTSSTNKGNSLLKNARTCVFDEYIIDTSGGMQRYLANEMRTLFDLLETFFRTNSNTRVFILSNNISEVNPLYLYFGINFKRSKVWVDNDIYAESLTTSEDLIALKNASPIARITNKYDEEYNQYNINNEVLTDTEKFICNKFNSAIQLFTIVDNCNYYVYKTHSENRLQMFIGKEGNDNHKLKFTFDVERVTEEVQLIDRQLQPLAIKNLVNAYKRGILFFEDVQTKAILTERLKKYF